MTGNDRGHLEDFVTEYAGSEVGLKATGSCRYISDILDKYLNVTLVNPSENAGDRRGKNQKPNH